MPRSSSMQQRFFVWLSDNPGEAILRWIFRIVVTVTIAALAVDLAGMNGWGGRPPPPASAEQGSSHHRRAVAPCPVVPRRRQASRATAAAGRSDGQADDVRVG